MIFWMKTKDMMGFQRLETEKQHEQRPRNGEHLASV